MNKQKTTHPKQSSQHTLVSNQSTNDGNGEEEKFVDNLFHSIADEEERLIEIKNFRINIAIQLDDVKEDLQFEKKMLMVEKIFFLIIKIHNCKNRIK